MDQSIKQMSRQVHELFCEDSSNQAIRKVYESSTTRAYRKDVGYEGFREEVKRLKGGGACESLKDQGLVKLFTTQIQKGNLQFKSDTKANGDIIISFTLEDRIIRLDLVSQGQDENGEPIYLIDFFEVKEI